MTIKDIADYLEANPGKRLSLQFHKGDFTVRCLDTVTSDSSLARRPDLEEALATTMGRQG
jgi:hypothetical protein